MNMKGGTYKKALVILFTAAFFFISCEKNESVVAADISIDGLQSHMEFIASDETEGRMTASAGFKKAADYVVERFESAGLNPGWVDSSGGESYYQTVPFIRYIYGKNNVLTVRKDGKIEKLSRGESTFIVANPGKGSMRVPLHAPVFVGYGIHEPGMGWDDLSGLDLEGKLAVIVAGFPANAESGPDFPSDVRRKYADRRNGDALRFRSVIEKGAAGVIAIPDRYVAANWEAVVSQLKRSIIVPEQSQGSSSRGRSPVPSLLIHADLVSGLFDDLGFDAFAHQGDYRTFEMNDLELALSLDVEVQKAECFNIIGVISGTDPELSKEYITLGAHLDHLGRDGEVIYYGANDNASSCALILEVAEAVARDPLPRSLMIIFFTAEEIGHFGSLHFVAHPPVPHDQVVLNINLEQIGAKSRLVDGIGAIGPATQEVYLNAAHEKVEGIALQFDEIETQVPVISGSDTLSFYQSGLPAVILGSGGFPEHHTPDDNLDLIDYDHLYKASLFVKAYIEELGRSKFKF